MPAGKRKGFEDTRGTLFFEIARFASILRPRLLFLENVKGLLNHNGGDTFETILSALDELGYDAEWQVLNSKNFGVPQNRERVFIIGHLRGECTKGVFPLGGEGQKFDSEQLEIDIVGNTKNPNSTALGTSSVVYGSKGLIGTLCARDYKEPKQIAIPVLTPERPEKRQNGRRFKEDGEPMFTLTSQDRHGIVVAGKLPGNHDQNSRVYNPRGLAPTLSTMQGRGQEPKIIQKARGFNKGAQHSIAPTLSSNSWQENNLVKVVDFYNKITKDEVGTLTSSGGGSTVRAGSFGITDGYRIRKLTPRECWRLQGFPDWAFDKAQEVNSNSQLYKQAGNSVTVNVIEAISKKFE